MLLHILNNDLMRKLRMLNAFCIFKNFIKKNVCVFQAVASESFLFTLFSLELCVTGSFSLCSTAQVDMHCYLY